MGLAVAAALVVMPSGPAPLSSAAAAADRVPPQRAASAAASSYPLFGRKADGHLYDYEPDRTGGLRAGVDLGGGYGEATALVQADISDGGAGNDLYLRMENTLYYTAERGGETKVIGGGWDIYTLLICAGNLGGSAEPDLVGRDKEGALWLYQGRPDGTLAGRIRIGSGGWNAMTGIAGRGDYTGDGKADLLARDTKGILYIYPGTGNAAADVALGSRVTVGTGWNAYDALVSAGDTDGDGKADLIARDPAGALWLFKGTGESNAPFAARVKIGTGGWGAYNVLF
ncbi:hypothetical protein DMH18_10070 [Streptomyces sp. WAC 06783]|nr:hypothetical protein DMH18_10070 [Streptomyces sp. WAC 06783]